MKKLGLPGLPPLPPIGNVPGELGKQVKKLQNDVPTDPIGNIIKGAQQAVDTVVKGVPRPYELYGTIRDGFRKVIGTAPFPPPPGEESGGDVLGEIGDEAIAEDGIPFF